MFRQYRSFAGTGIATKARRTVDNPNATQIETWTQWDIDLQEFLDQGVNMTDVHTIGLGFGDRNNPQPGGSGKMCFDDIRLRK